ncbi:hypothetical protein HYH02_008066 [Chlamydomonas schloesseri]|uniref:BTB domain-containing protein n=1 Tax=Chlamydomonas schloesseri TaxID=2026947 RepID=A0A835WH56_9CHLO|nr:hypothetical protein HYH02_008066 [Chlamydomonas schloesseri]|eukprot:KAG2446910.1 hypothetical protein HYH02_008066 [Chlamydomonas schloesseri]
MPPATATATAATATPNAGGYPAVLQAATPQLADFLALLERPGPTSDLTIIAAATSGGGGGGNSRNFNVHRAILAARWPYFATLFASGLGDSGARELPLPDIDPDDLQVLLRFVYGGELVVASRKQTHSCAALADRLLLPQAVGLLQEHLLSTLSVDTIIADLMWAAGLPDPLQWELFVSMLDFCGADVEEELPLGELQQLAAARPELMAQLYTARRRAAGRLRS